MDVRMTSPFDHRWLSGRRLARPRDIGEEVVREIDLYVYPSETSGHSNPHRWGQGGLVRDEERFFESMPSSAEWELGVVQADVANPY